MGALLHLVAARLCRQPSRSVAPALGIALAVAFAIASVAEGTIAADEAARSVLGAVPAAGRVVRVTRSGPATPAVDARAWAVLRSLGVRRPTEALLADPVRLDALVVRPAAIAPLSRWLGAGVPGPCRAADCPVVAAGGAALVGRTLSAGGVRLRVVGAATLRSAVPLGFTGGGGPLLLTGDVAGWRGCPG